MGKLATILLLTLGLMTTSMYSEKSINTVVEPEPTYLTTESFNKAINSGIVVVEFMASFVEPFGEWEAIEDGVYYRVNIETYPDLKKKWKIRSLPTIIVFQNGSKELTYRANIMMELDVTAEDIHEDIEDLLSDKF